MCPDKRWETRKGRDKLCETALRLSSVPTVDEFAEMWAYLTGVKLARKKSRRPSGASPSTDSQSDSATQRMAEHLLLALSVMATLSPSLSVQQKILIYSSAGLSKITQSPPNESGEDDPFDGYGDFILIRSG